jgi:hypothetical protein
MYKIMDKVVLFICVLLLLVSIVLACSPPGSVVSRANTAIAIPRVSRYTRSYSPYSHRILIRRETRSDDAGCTFISPMGEFIKLGAA